MPRARTLPRESSASAVRLTSNTSSGRSFTTRPDSRARSGRDRSTSYVILKPSCAATETTRTARTATRVKTNTGRARIALKVSHPAWPLRPGGALGGEAPVLVPDVDDASLALVAEEADRRGPQRQVATVYRRQPDPARGQDSQDVRVGEQRDVAVDGVDPGDHAPRPLSHLLHALALRHRGRPDRPSGLLNAHGRGGAAFVDPVVPFQQVVGHLGGLGEAGQATRLLRAPERDRQHEREPLPGEMTAQRPPLPHPLGRQRNVGAAGVLPALAPLRLPVAHEPDPMILIHAPSPCPY